MPLKTNFGAFNMKFSCLLARVCWVENWLIFGLIACVRPLDIIETFSLLTRQLLHCNAQ